MALNTVLINKCNFYSYPDHEYNFSPSENYPEYKFDEISPEKNNIYEAVRNSFFLMGYDAENYGTPFWNPLKNFIRPGDTVLLKPNLVLHYNCNSEFGMDCIITDPGIIRAVGDYALLALKNTGTLIIGDAPVQECDFEKLINQQGIDKIEYFYKKQYISTKLELLDFRNYKSRWENNVLVSEVNSKASGITVDLAAESEFAKISAPRYKKLRVTNYPHTIMQNHHNEIRNEYIVAKKLLEADVIINMPKPKTHRFAGVTLSMKNLIGINVSKECLPHHSVGSIHENGDEYEDKNILKELYSNVIDVRNIYMRNEDKQIAKTLRSIEGTLLNLLDISDRTFFGSWHGNDTIWRTIIDVNKIAFFADKNGQLQDTPQRKMLIIGDMIVAGEESGPLSPTPKNTGVIVVAEDPVCFDEVVCSYMGYDYNKIPTIRNARNIRGKYNYYCNQDAVIKSNITKLDNKKTTELTYDMTEHFIPNPSWKDYLP